MATDSSSGAPEKMSGFKFSWFALYLFFPVVLPNSLRSFTVPIFVVVGTYALATGIKYIGQKAFAIYLSFATVSFIYLFIGVLKIGSDAVEWVVFVYILAPLLWLAIWSKIVHKFRIEEIVRVLLFYGVLGCFSIIAFFIVFKDSGADTLAWLIAAPNAEIEDGRVRSTMHVFGSLIFIVAGLFSAPNVIRRKSIQYTVLPIFLIAAFISGRSALLLAIAVGLFLNLTNLGLKNGRWLRITIPAIAAIPIIFLVSNILSTYVFENSDIQYLEIIKDTVEKISEGGGEERILQYSSLADGIGKDLLLGAGHGVGTAVIRSEASPWKYELLWLSTLFHVGLPGFLVYLMPMVLMVLAYQKLRIAGCRNDFDVFLFSGFISISIASMTNPYLESFDFQWMVILPCTYFYSRVMALRKLGDGRA